METVIAFGDSVLKGIIYENGNYKVTSASFMKILAGEYGLEVVNKARFGCTVTKGAKIFGRNIDLVRESDSRFVVLEFGGNDCAYDWTEVASRPEDTHATMTPVPEFVATYTGIIREIKELGKTPVLLSLPPIDSEKYFGHISQGLPEDALLRWFCGDKSHIASWHERYNLEVFKLASGCGVPVIDITSAFLSSKNYTRFLCDDGIHPNREGHKLIAEAIAEEAGKGSFQRFIL